MMGTRIYKNTMDASNDNQAPDRVPVTKISLTKPQYDRLVLLASQANQWHKYLPGSLTPYDTLSDWGLIDCRWNTCRITKRGLRRVNGETAKDMHSHKEKVEAVTQELVDIWPVHMNARTAAGLHFGRLIAEAAVTTIEELEENN